MMLNTPYNSFLQIGATRDGLDPYLDACSGRGMKSILIETPDYLQWRRKLKRRSFDLEIPVGKPTDPHQVLTALGELNKSLKLVLPGFERYVECAYTLAGILQISPWRKPHFLPLDKENQRILLARKAGSIRQPTYLSVSLKDAEAILSLNLKYPIVIKPVNGGGGLGVFLINKPSQLATALAELQKLTNYDGSFFENILLEEYIPGVEHSIQGFAHEGRAVILTVCEKFILNERYSQSDDLWGFRECGHIVVSDGNSVNPETYHLAQSCIDAFGYHEGPFHIDFIQNSEDIYFLEMGFRLSGGNLVNLVRKATGIDWAEVSFASHLESFPSIGVNSRSVGQMVAVSSEQLKRGEYLQSKGYAVEVETFSPLYDLTTFSSGSLAADIMRHTGALGRITVSAADATEVKRLLQLCVSTPLLV